MTFYSSLFTSPLHFLPFLDSKTFSSTSFRSQCSKHPHQLMWLGPGTVLSSLLHYFICSSQQTCKLRAAPLPGPHRRRQAWSMTRPSHRGRSAFLDSPHPSLLRAEALFLPKCISAPEHFLHDSSFSLRSQNEISTNIPWFNPFLFRKILLPIISFFSPRVLSNINSCLFLSLSFLIGETK